jgi:hypothetical protein
LISAEDVAKKVVCGPNPKAIVEKIGEFADAGFDHVFIHQVGPRQEEFLDFAKVKLLGEVDDQLGRSEAIVPAGTSTPSDSQ